MLDRPAQHLRPFLRFMPPPPGRVRSFHAYPSGLATGSSRILRVASRWIAHASLRSAASSIIAAKRHTHISVAGSRECTSPVYSTVGRLDCRPQSSSPCVMQ